MIVFRDARREDAERQAAKFTWEASARGTFSAYEKAMRDLHVELVKVQEWVRHTGAKICIGPAPRRRPLAQSYSTVI